MIPTIDKTATAEKLKRLITAKHITPNDIKEYLNLSCVQTVYRWLEGVNIPSVDNLYAISKLLNISMDALIVGTGDKKTSEKYFVIIKRLDAYCKRIRDLKVA